MLPLIVFRWGHLFPLYCIQVRSFNLCFPLLYSSGEAIYAPLIVFRWGTLFHLIVFRWGQLCFPLLYSGEAIYSPFIVFRYPSPLYLSSSYLFRIFCQPPLIKKWFILSSSWNFTPPPPHFIVVRLLKNHLICLCVFPYNCKIPILSVPQTWEKLFPDSWLQNSATLDKPVSLLIGNLLKNIKKNTP